MVRYFHIFVVHLLLLSGSHEGGALHIDTFASDDENYYELEPQLNEENLKIPERNLEDPQAPRELGGEIYIQGNSPFSYVGGFGKPLKSFSPKYPIRDNAIEAVGGDPGLGNQIIWSDYNNKLFSNPATKWIGKVEDVPPRKWRRDAVRKKRRKRFQARGSGFKKGKRYLDYTNSQMPFNEGQKQQNAKKSQFTDKLCENSKTCMNDFEGRGDFEMKRNRPGRRIRLPLRSEERNFEMLQDDSDPEYSRVRRYLDHKRFKKRINMTPTLEAKEAAMSRVLDPNLNLDGILEPHVRKRRGKV